MSDNFRERIKDELIRTRVVVEAADTIESLRTQLAACQRENERLKTDAQFSRMAVERAESAEQQMNRRRHPRRVSMDTPYLI